MIVPLKHVTLLCVAAEGEQTLVALREMGVMHLNLSAADSERYRHAQARLAAVRQTQVILRSALADKPVTATVAAAHKAQEQEKALNALLQHPLPELTGDVEARIKAVQTLADMRQDLVDEAARLEREIACYKSFGDFDVSLPSRLTAEGVPVRLFRRPANTTFSAPDGACVQVFESNTDFIYGVMVGAGELCATCEILKVPEASVSVMRTQRDQALSRIARITDLLKRAAEHAEDLEQEAAGLTEESDFATALDTMQAHEAVAWITGWVPVESEKMLRETARERAWGLLLRDPDQEEYPPTLLRPPLLFRPMQSLFGALGIAPTYREADVSVPFFCFFSIFFAMLVGDGGYGVLILLLTLYMRKKLPKAPTSPFILLTVFSVATMIWGALSNTWFGFHPAVLHNAVSAWFTQPNGKGDSNMMLFCFTLGVAHLSLARLWNAIAFFPDTKFLAQLGWVGVIWFMYFTAGSVVGVLHMPSFMKVVLGVSVAMIALFMLKKDELKSNGADLGMLPLNIISCLGDIISYVRLFAVGLASVKVAENFNEMALGLDLPMIVKIPCMILILLFGHGLNFLMAGLAVLVHAVRLNTLEFSNHKGITWAGFAFKAFKRNADVA